MHTIDRVLPAPHGIPADQLHAAPRLVLPFAERSKSRLRARLLDGEEVALFLPRGTVLRGGDLVMASDGRRIFVDAAPEAVLEVRAADPHVLMRAVYHLGNRHIPVEIGRDYLRLGPDSVLAEMLTRLGAVVTPLDAPFEPEAGAYGGGHRHGHDATFAEDYEVAQATFRDHHGHGHEHHDHEHHDHEHEHDHDHPHPHPHPHR